MPNIKAAYEKYASKGFEVISISIDQKLKPWRAAIEELGMNWIQLSDVDALISVSMLYLKLFLWILQGLL